MNRQWLKKKFSFLLRNSWVLMYHRVATPATDAWNLAVSPEKFEEQILWLSKNHNVLPLNSFMEQWAAGKLKKWSTAITFDDGYTDNFTTAAPLLEEYNLPATFFICTDNLQHQQTYWWDELAAIILETPILPKHFSTTINGSLLEFDTSPNETLLPETQKQLATWRYPSAPPNKRAAMYLAVWNEIRATSEAERQQTLRQLSDWAGVAEKKTHSSIMLPTQLKTLQQNLLFTLGAHTITHPALQYLTEEEQKHQIIESKKWIEKTCGKQIDFLAYPYGSYNEQTPKLARDAGFKAAFTTQNIAANKCTNPYLIGRAMMTSEMDYPNELR